MNSTEATHMEWRKSSHSNGQANCVEVAAMQGTQARVAIRDGKAADGQFLIFTAQAWRRLTNRIEASASQ